MKIGFVYWCEGAGHATRNLAVASECRSRGAEVVMTGGGPGKKFVEMNGFEDPVPEEVTFTEKKVNSDISGIRLLKTLLTDEIPSYFRRFLDIYRWLKDEDPDKVVTDDILGIIAASIQGRELYRIEHLTPDILPGHAALMMRGYNWFTVRTGAKIFVTSVWDDRYEDAGIINVDPLAQEGEKDVEDFDILIIPGTMSKDFESLKESLEGRGFDVVMVGDDDWEMSETMTPYTEAADCVICTGFSSIADTVVTGTPCLVYPFASGQKAIADEIERRDLKGLEKVTSEKEAVEKAEKYVRDGKKSPECDNGAKKLTDIIMTSN